MSAYVTPGVTATFPRVTEQEWRGLFLDITGGGAVMQARRDSTRTEFYMARLRGNPVQVEYSPSRVMILSVRTEPLRLTTILRHPGGLSRGRGIVT